MRAIRLLTVLGTMLLGGCGRPAPEGAGDAPVDAPLRVGSHVVPAESVQAYLERELGFTSRGGRVFCSYAVLGQEGVRVFVAAACEELVAGPDSVESGSGMGGPVALHVDTAAGARIRGHQVPGDGNRYARDVRRIFPAPVAERIREARGWEGLRDANRSRAAADSLPGPSLRE